MARSVTLKSLRNQVRQRADIETANSRAGLAETSGRFTDDELNEYINQSYAEMYEYLALSVQDYNITSTTISTSQGIDTYGLPADFFKFRMLTVKIGGVTLPVLPFHLEEIDQYSNSVGSVGWNMGVPVRYTRSGQNVMFAPAPDGTYSIKVWYTPAPARMGTDTDTIDGQGGWEEFIVLDAAVKVMTKDDRDPANLVPQRELERQRIVRMAGTADFGQPYRPIRRWRSKNWKK